MSNNRKSGNHTYDYDCWEYMTPAEQHYESSNKNPWSGSSKVILVVLLVYWLISLIAPCIYN